MPRYTQMTGTYPAYFIQDNSSTVSASVLALSLPFSIVTACLSMPPRQRSSLPYKALSVARSWGNLRAIYRNSAILRFRSQARQYTSPWRVKLNIWVPSSPITTSAPSHWNTASANARATHSRLRKVLQGRRSLALRQRVLLWQSTVLPSALYGLGSCGLTGPQIQRLHQVLLKQLRAIARAPSHITHESDEALLERLCVLGPAATLLCLHEKALSTRDDLDGFLQGPSHPWTTLLHEAWRHVGGPSQHGNPFSRGAPGYMDAS